MDTRQLIDKPNAPFKEGPAIIGSALVVSSHFITEKKPQRLIDGLNLRNRSANLMDVSI